MSNEHPIIFNEWSTRRILAGEKTQTRRVATEDSICNRIEWTEDVATIGGEKGSTYTGWAKGYPENEGPPFGIPIKCPYGEPGDVLWVREAFQLPLDKKDMSPKEYVETYRQYAWKYRLTADGTKEEGQRAGVHFGRKRPSIHMPRELCRLRLRVEDVRVERIREIDADDAIAEGIPKHYNPDVMPDDIGSVELDKKRRTIHELAFKALWQSIHGDDAWERNQWVWVVEFSRINE